MKYCSMLLQLCNNLQDCLLIPILRYYTIQLHFHAELTSLNCEIVVSSGSSNRSVCKTYKRRNYVVNHQILINSDPFDLYIFCNFNPIYHNDTLQVDQHRWYIFWLFWSTCNVTFEQMRGQDVQEFSVTGKLLHLFRCCSDISKYFCRVQYSKSKRSCQLQSTVEA